MINEQVRTLIWNSEMREHEMMMWASAQWSNEGLLKMINEQVRTLIWNDDVSQGTVVQSGVIEND